MAQPYCAFCEEFVPANLMQGEYAGWIRQHVLTCEKHPLHEANHKIAIARAALKEALPMLDSDFENYREVYGSVLYALGLLEDDKDKE